LLRRATVLDWSRKLQASARDVARARALVGGTAAPELEVRCLFAEGRSHWRADRHDDAIGLLEAAVAQARACGDRETEVQAMVTLSSALNRAGRWDRAEAQFRATIELCEQLDDPLHLGAATINRSAFRHWRGDLDGALADADRTRELAVQLGYFQLETGALNTRFEISMTMGRFDQARRTAGEVIRIHRQMQGEPELYDRVMALRAAAAAGDRPDAADCAAAIGDAGIDALPPSYQPPARAAALFAGACRDRDRWAAAARSARALFAYDGRLEVLYLCAREAAEQGDQELFRALVGEAEQVLAKAGAWRERFAALR
jgi:tetratricopeptide (TPR) repeat protein